MLIIEHCETFGWEAAIRGMRNPLNSWNASDSIFTEDGDYWNIREDEPAEEDIQEFTNNYYQDFMIGENDLNLMTRLRNAGTDHRKFMRMITVYMDITAPLYWWKEFDTYKVGTVANSCSTMHKLAAKEFTLNDFSYDHLSNQSIDILKTTINALNQFRDLYTSYDSYNHSCGDWTKEHYWWQMIQLLPSSYNQKRTVMLNYETLANIYKSRKDHKLDEWKNFCMIIKGILPYSELICGEENKK